MYKIVMILWHYELSVRNMDPRNQSRRGMREMSVDLLNLIFQDVFWGVTLIKTLRLTRSRRFSQCQRAQFIGG